jgi:S-adenosylmethionine decarboxylase proenzyme
MEPKSNGRAQSRAGAEPSSYSVKVSQRFIVLSLVSSILVAFAVGRTARVILIDRPYRETLLVQQAFLAASQNRNTGIIDLPNPTLQEGKIAPKTIYTSKNFDSTKSNRVTSRWIVSETGGSGIDVSGTDEGTCGAGEVPGRCSAKSGAADGSLFVDEEDHFPAGQHLLLDYENVQSAFLDSEERLVTAMLTLVNLCGLTLLSYHCHSLEPSGVSCAGVLLESHVSFHTWPGDGVITLDLYTCGPDSLLPILPVAEKLFKIKETPSYAGEKLPDPEMVWLYKLRGFRENDDVADITDLMHYPIGSRLDYKKEVCTNVSQYTEKSALVYSSFLFLLPLDRCCANPVSANRRLRRPSTGSRKNA